MCHQRRDWICKIYENNWNPSELIPLRSEALSWNFYEAPLNVMIFTFKVACELWIISKLLLLCLSRLWKHVKLFVFTICVLLLRRETKESKMRILRNCQWYRARNWEQYKIQSTISECESNVSFMNAEKCNFLYCKAQDRGGGDMKWSRPKILGSSVLRNYSKMLKGFPRKKGNWGARTFNFTGFYQSPGFTSLSMKSN